MLGATMMMVTLSHAQDNTKQDTSQAADAPQPVTELQTGKSDTVGSYLTDANGRALYLFLSDTSMMSNCTGDCATIWMPVRVTDANSLPTVAEGMDKSLLGTIKRDDGTLQLSYNGWPLYYYSMDTAANDMTGQGVNDKWYLVTPEGMGASITAGEPGGGPAPEAAP